ncbi:hypothetical protein GWK36_12315 [Caldichromatium japonicum]|uniref:Uncharacterized protein n=1 Tax=Caldichromatium japonicum TaxID=2699430 RepID=A0A6G7VFI4_9GAMM|nr:hypothetical protein [Caldichromatium japonicum]QIK38636.1 hypothetical protein GWK36_12315 [Caldichromatium japonicum]
MPVLAQRAGFILDEAVATWRAAGIELDDANTTLENIARANRMTPAALFALIPNGPPAARDPAAIEAQLAGSGLGAKTLADFAEHQGLIPERARAHLKTLGIEAEINETLKTIAERHAVRPIELAKAILIPGYRPKPYLCCADSASLSHSTGIARA